MSCVTQSPVVNLCGSPPYPTYRAGQWFPICLAEGCYLTNYKLFQYSCFKEEKNRQTSLGRGRSSAAIHKEDGTAATTDGKFTANSFLQHISLCDKANCHMGEEKTVLCRLVYMGS